MIRNLLAASLVIGLVAASANAGIVVNVGEGVAIPALPGYKSFTLTAVSDGAAIQGFDFTGDPSAPVDPSTSRGFFGAMSQLNPAGFATVFNDNNALIPALLPGHTAAEDSQFLFKSTDLLVIPGSATESATSLRGAFSTTTNFGQSIAFAQLVIPDAAAGTVNYRGVVGTTDGLEFNIDGVVMNGGQVDPPIVGDLAKTQVTFGEVLTGAVSLANVTGLAFDNVNAPSYVPTIPGKTLALPNLPTLDAAGNFSWDTTNAKRGVYEWAITGTGAGGATDAGKITVTVTQVPEPATLAFVGLALVGVAGVARKRS